MNSLDVNFNIGPRLSLTFALLIALILGGNGLLLWQFHIARQQTDHLAGVNQQAIAVLRLQQSLFSFHQRLEELVQSRDAHRLIAEAEPLRKSLLEGIQESRTALTHLPETAAVDPAFLQTLDGIEIVLSSQLEAVTELARSGEWVAIRLRLANELGPLETQTSTLVKSIDQEVSGEQLRATANMINVQRRILFLVPTMAISSFSIAAFFAWAVARRIIKLRFDERLAERTRLARELHDTLLQSFQGLMIRFQTIEDMLPARPIDAKNELEGALDRADQALLEGRRAIKDMRISTLSDPDLAQSLTTLMSELDQELAKYNQVPVTFRVLVEGTPQTVRPILLDEIYLVARESLRNAFRHAQARRIEVEITYRERLLGLRVRDDGKGIDSTTLEEGARSGHWGVPGMRERAKRIGAKLDIWSELGAGTEVELSIPGRIAYQASSARALFGTFWRKNKATS
jgi:signal transduction histidine kinase